MEQLKTTDTRWIVELTLENEVHVRPLGDIIPHLLSHKCACNPEVTREPDYLPVVVHNAYDRRETDEFLIG